MRYNNNNSYNNIIFKLILYSKTNLGLRKHAYAKTQRLENLFESVNAQTSLDDTWNNCSKERFK